MVSRTGRIVLWVLVLASLALNVYLLTAWLSFRGGVISALTTVQESLGALAAQRIQVEVTVDQDVPINTIVPVDQEIVVPLDLDYPLSTTVSTGFDIPLLGRQEVVLPVEATIPIHQTFSTRLQLRVPISFTYHLTAQIPVEFTLPPEIGVDLSQLLDQMMQTLR